MDDQKQWVRLNPLTQCYETRDGTKVAAELVDSAVCLADVLYVAKIREEQRSAPSKEAGNGGL